jgi:ubiquinone/menaquinone biosynthesis C-methylase UbiE
METLPEWAAKFYELYSAPYVPTSEAAKARVESGLPKILKHLPRKGSSVLDLCCGGGAYLFALEKAGYKVTGLDIQRKMINEARRMARKTKSKATLVVGDAKSPKFGDESFHAIVFLGAPFGHFSMEEFESVAEQALRMLKHKGRVIAEVNDHVALFMSGMYQRILYEPSGDEDLVSIHTRYDGEEGTFNRLFLDLETNKRFKGSFRIWTPWVFNYLMKKVGFERKASEPGSFGTFSRLMVYAKP